MFKKDILLQIALLISNFCSLYAADSESLERILKTCTSEKKYEILNKLFFEFEFKDTLKAKEFLEEELILSKKNFNKHYEALTLQNFGHMFLDKSEYQKALKYYLESLIINEKLKNEKGVGDGNVNLGNVYLTLGDFKKSLLYYNNALMQYKLLNDKNNISMVLGNIGAVNLQLQKYKKALYYLLEAEKIDRQTENKQSLSAGLSNIGTTYREMGQYQFALKYLFEALEIKKQLGNDYSTTILAIAGVYEKLNDRKMAIEYYRQSIEFFKRNSDYNRLQIAYAEMSNMYKRWGNYPNAFQYLELYLQIRDSLFTQEKLKVISDMEGKYQSEKKQKEIVLLTKTNEQEAMMKNFLGGGVIMVLMLSGVIYNRYRVKNNANRQLSMAYGVIEEKNQIVEEKNKSITDSIKYAKRIQEAMLPRTTFSETFGSNAFILHKPKDIVSGDFYWIEQKENKVLFSVVDCTGHGVPGAFMSIVGYNVLNQAVNEKNITSPGPLLTELNKGVTATLKQKVEDSTIRDGMDIALCSLDYATMQAEYAGAYNPLWLFRAGTLIEKKADKMPIGNFLEEETRTFTNHHFEIEKNDVIYLFSDGYADQFGGPSRKKFKYNRLKELLQAIHDKPMAEQKEILDDTIETWKAGLEQIDDILILGVRI